MSTPLRSCVLAAESYIAAAGETTLVELLAVIALIAIVAAIGAPFYLSSRRAQETTEAARELIAALKPGATARDHAQHLLQRRLEGGPARTPLITGCLEP
jgi:type II secretory pathway component PulJ